MISQKLWLTLICQEKKIYSVRSIKKIDKREIENTITLIANKEFDKDPYKGFETYIDSHLLTKETTSIISTVVAGVDYKVTEILDARRENAVMKASLTAKKDDDAAKVTA